MQNQTPAKTSFPQMEENVQKFWEENKIFEKSLTKEAPNGDFVFYDGPPFATGLPHYGHIVANTIKDIIPRYKTMQGYRVARQWGWDCHGLPVENLIEKELGLKTKEDIFNFGVAKFNEACELSVMRYASEWKKFIPRMGRWADMANDYKTMNPEYMESIWWVFKKLYDKGLIYEGHKTMHLCPRCETTLSNFEVGLGYKDVKDLTVIAKFKIKNSSKIQNPKFHAPLESLAEDSSEGVRDTSLPSFSQESPIGRLLRGEESAGDVYILAWTTTPWTLPGNVALAVGEEIDYIKFKIVKSTNKSIAENDSYIISKDFFNNFLGNPVKIENSSFFKIEATKWQSVFSGTEIAELQEFKGKELVSTEYEPLFDYFAPSDERGSTPLKGVEPLKGSENGWKVYAGDFVVTGEGTGIVHIAPAFGEDDMNLGKKYDLPFVQHVKPNGRFVDEVKDFAGMEVKPKDDPSKTDIEIIKWLAHNNKLFHKEKQEHSYPHCWRCESPLLNYATSSWFVSVTKIKDKMLENNGEINWMPENVKEGRFGKWLENARDWAISRSRFWGAPLPVWRCDSNVETQNLASVQQQGCGHIKVFGNVAELEKLSGQKITDLHKQFVDKIEIKCEKCGGVMKRIPEVLDCWFESGSMPYAQNHYLGKPLENFDPENNLNFPANFIAEGIDQTRGWFYTLTVLATALFEKPAFKNVIVNGIVLAEDGQKMSKSLKNYPDPNEIINKYGADAVRFYLMSSPVVKAGDLDFSEKGVNEVFQKVTMLLWNVYDFYKTYQSQLETVGAQNFVPTNLLDKWILAKLDLLINEMTENLDKYDLQKASRPILEFINELSTWYLRRSRDRFKFGEEEDKQSALRTMNYTLLTLSKLMAPIMPFIAESLYQKVKDENGSESVHLEEFPKAMSNVNGQIACPEPVEGSKVITEMDLARKIVEAGLFERSKNQIKIRQVLNSFSTTLAKENELPNEIIEIIKDELNIKTLKFGEDELDITLTPELILEGYSREIIRTINLLRKDAELSINDSVEILFEKNDELEKIFETFGKEILKDTLATKYNIFSMNEIEMKKEIKVGEVKVWIGIKY
jgi:isoleucyl-tRNA synthetase